MKSYLRIFLSLFLAVTVLQTGCKTDPCEEVLCQNGGTCIEGDCDCPDGFSGVNCEIALCFGVDCINGDCDPQTQTCKCNPNYYGEGCDILCVNGEFANGDCNCSEGYEGITCETEIRNRFIGWWDCDQWTSASQMGDSPSPGFIPAVITIAEGYNILEVELFPTERSSGLMLLSSDNRIVGQVTERTINFEFQDLSTAGTVYGSASLVDRILSIELHVFNLTTSLTEVARGTFTKH